VAKSNLTAQSNKSELSGLVNNLNRVLSTLAAPQGKGNNMAKQRPKKKNSTVRRQRQVRDRQDLGSAPLSLGYVQPPVGMRSAAPTKPGAEVRFVGCDYIGSVSAQTTATDNPYSLQPIHAATYPRLSAIASIFGKYSYNKLKFYVIGKAASTLPGDMTSVTVYEDGGFGSLTEAQVKNRFGQTTSKFWENHLHTVDPKKATVPWYIMNSYDSGADGAVAIFGFYHFFTEAVTAVMPVADLFVEYDVEFCEAQAIGDTD